MSSRGVSRRQFIWAAAGAGGNALLCPGWLRAAGSEPDARVEQVITASIGIDMHNHVYPAGTEPHPHFTPTAPGGHQQPGPALRLADELKKSGFTAVCASFVLDFADNKRLGDARGNLLRWFTAIDKQLEDGNIRRALTLKDLQSAHEHAQPTLVQSVEGSQFIEGKLDRVAEVYQRGVRHLQLLHMADDRVAPLGDMNTGRPKFGGLTSVGVQTIKECNRLGILVDMAHASPQTVLGALQAATQPLIISHTNLDTWTGKNARMAEIMKPRLISKEHAKVVADAGGIVGVWTHLADSPEEFVDSVKAMIDAIGIDHVGIGSDTDLLSSRVGGGTNRAWPEMTQGFFAVVVTEMLRQGFTPEDISKVGGGNYCRVFDAVTSGH